MKTSKYADLPEVFETYLAYCQSRFCAHKLGNIRRVLGAFACYLDKHAVALNRLNIQQLDWFLAEFMPGLRPSTQQIYRSYIRGFLSYLYHQRKMTSKNFAPLVVGRRIFSQQKPPKFLTASEVKRLFESLQLETAAQLRTYAMVHLAYTLGLRPVEISLITLDDIGFARAELSLKCRKADNPIILPVPDATLKAVAAYLIGGRAKSDLRSLFLTLYSPLRPVSASSVSQCIKAALKAVGLPFSAYALRHTYAQNLLQSGASIYEIKEMLGHDKISSSEKYLHIDFNMMRSVLFDQDV